MLQYGTGIVGIGILTEHFFYSDADVVHEVVIEKRDALEKPLELYSPLDLFGPSIVSTNGAEWKKHRSLSQPGFSESNLKLVAESTTELSYDLFSKWDPMIEKSPETPIEIDGFMNEFTLGKKFPGIFQFILNIQFFFSNY